MKTKEKENDKIILILKDQSESGLSNIVLCRNKILSSINKLKDDVKSMRLMRDDYCKSVKERDIVIDELRNELEVLKVRIDGGIRVNVCETGPARYVCLNFANNENNNATLILDEGVEIW